MSPNEHIFKRLFGDLVYLPYNKQILFYKIQMNLETYRQHPDVEIPNDVYFDVFLYENYDELVDWCQKTNKTIQYIN
jgi:hypothetical protein